MSENPTIPADFFAGLHLAAPTTEELREGALARWSLQASVQIDAWPESVRALSMPTTLIPIDPADIELIYDYGNPDAAAVLDKYAAAIDEVTDWSNHFIRLNTRSPKDSAQPGLPITCAGKQAMMWISTSERCMDDLHMLLYAEKPAYIAIREWRPINTASEIRCFARNGKLLGVTRYDYRNEPRWDWATHEEQILDLATAFYDQHLAAHYPDVVFDLAPDQRSDAGTPLLIELNPYGLSDPCCFASYDEIETEGGLRFTRKAR